MDLPLLVIVFLVVAGLAVLPLTYYLRSRRNPGQTKAPPGATEKTFKEWKD